MTNILLENTLELLKERTSFCDVFIANSDHFSNEQMDEFLECHDDFENGILIVKTLRRKCIDSAARKRMIEFMKNEIMGHIDKMIMLCKEQKETITNEKEILQIESKLSFLNDCSLEILTLTNEAIL